MYKRQYLRCTRYALPPSISFHSSIPAIIVNHDDSLRPPPVLRQGDVHTGMGPTSNSTSFVFSYASVLRYLSLGWPSPPPTNLLGCTPPLRHPRLHECIAFAAKGRHYSTHLWWIGMDVSVSTPRRWCDSSATSLSAKCATLLAGQPAGLPFPCRFRTARPRCRCRLVWTSTDSITR